METTTHSFKELAEMQLKQHAVKVFSVKAGQTGIQVLSNYSPDKKESYQSMRERIAKERESSIKNASYRRRYSDYTRQQRGFHTSILPLIHKLVSPLDSYEKIA